MIKGKNLVNGKEVDCLNPITFKTFNAKDKTALSNLYENASIEIVTEACELADRIFDIYSNTSAATRAAFLAQIKIELEQDKESILKQYQLESGYPNVRAEGEFSRTLGQIQSFVDLLNEGSYVNAILDVGIEGIPDLRKMYYPIGSIVVFGASNFPLAFSTAGGDTISALAAGCPVILKGHPYHAGTSELVARAVIQALDKCNLPQGIFAHLHGEKIEVGSTLVEHPRVKGVGFTGSFKAGKALYDIAQKRKEPIPVFAEMGSINPVLILPERSISDSEIPTQISNSIQLGTGQFCTNPGLILICGNEPDSFVDQLVQNFGEANNMVHPKISENYQKQIQQIESQGVTLHRKSQADNSPAVGVISAESILDKPELLEEVFGPFSLVVHSSSTAVISQLIKTLPGQLTATVLGTKTDLENNKTLIGNLQQKVGRILFDGVPTGVAVCASMNHGGPFPASTDTRFTSVGTLSIERWLRPICFQDCPNDFLPEALKDDNPLQIFRTLNNNITKAVV